MNKKKNFSKQPKRKPGIYFFFHKEFGKKNVIINIVDKENIEQKYISDLIILENKAIFVQNNYYTRL